MTLTPSCASFDVHRQTLLYLVPYFVPPAAPHDLPSIPRICLPLSTSFLLAHVLALLLDSIVVCPRNCPFILSYVTPHMQTHLRYDTDTPLLFYGFPQQTALKTVPPNTRPRARRDTNLLHRLPRPREHLSESSVSLVNTPTKSDFPHIHVRHPDAFLMSAQTAPRGPPTGRCFSIAELTHSFVHNHHVVGVVHYHSPPPSTSRPRHAYDCLLPASSQPSWPTRPPLRSSLKEVCRRPLRRYTQLTP